MAKGMAPATVDVQAAVDRANALMPAANAGDEGALAKLQAVLDGAPALWKQVGDLGRQAELALIRAASGDNAVAKMAITRNLERLRRGIAGSSPTALERLLADRVAIGWLGLAVAEATYHQALAHGLEPADDDFHQKRVERAQRRYLAAIKTLATVRRLGVPVVQLNVADKQINVAG